MMTEVNMQQFLSSSSAKKTERATTESRERSAEQLFDTLEPVALAVGGSDLGTTEDPHLSQQQDATMTPRRGNW